MFKTAEEYVQRTEPAVKGLFASIKNFLEPLDREPVQVFVANALNEERYHAELEQWLRDSKETFRRRSEAERVSTFKTPFPMLPSVGLFYR